MLEYFAYKKYKKHQAEKEAEKAHASGHREERAPSLVLNEEDELFLRRIAEEGEPPHLPERPVVLNPEVGSTTGNDAQVSRTSTGRSSTERHRKDKGKGKEKENAPWDGKHERPKFSDRLSGLFSRNPKEGLHPKKDVPPHEAVKEQDDIARVLDNLNLSAVNNRAFSLSKESTELVEKFTLVLKDLVNGVPTAYDDLVGLLDDSQGTLAKSYDHLPSFLQKLVTTLPDKLMNNLAPELLAVATEAQGMDFDGTRKGEKSSGGGLMGAAKGFLKPNSLKDLVTKPGAVAGALKTIMNTLKLRWPAFMGTNVLWSLGLFVLLFVFWYCHKRGREVRLAAEGKAVVVDSEGRIVELPDDPQLEDRAHGDRDRHSHRSRGHELRSSRDRNRIEDEIPAVGSSSRRHSPHGSRRSKDSHRSKRSHKDERERRSKHSDRDETPYERSDKVCYQKYD